MLVSTCSKFRFLISYRYPRHLSGTSKYSRSVMSDGIDENGTPKEKHDQFKSEVSRRDKRGRESSSSPRKRRHVNTENVTTCESWEPEAKEKTSPLKTALSERREDSSALVVENTSGLNNAPCFVRTSISVAQLFSYTGGQCVSFHDQCFATQPPSQGRTQWREYSTFTIPHTRSGMPGVRDFPTARILQPVETPDYQDPAIAGKLRLPREWEYTESGAEHERRPLPGMQFSVMSYNVLAQKLLEDHGYLYENAQSESLQWQYRKELLLEEIASHKADVMCLQEVQEDHFQDFFQPQLEYLGYKGVYQKRTGDKSDGCATFYKEEKFSLANSHPVEYCRGGLLDRDNIALILELIPKTQVYRGSVDKLCVANTHLLFNPRRGDIKLGQLMVLMAELDKCAHMSTNAASALDYCPVILCGDFNCEPHSDLYKFVARGYLQYHGLIARFLSGQKDGRYGRDQFLRKNFFCSSFGITDQCQYQQVLNKRFSDTTSKDSTPSPSPSTTAVEEDSSSPSSSSCENKEVHGDPMRSPPDLHRDHSVHLGPLGTSYGFSNNPSELPQSTMGSGQLWHRLNFVSSYKHTIARLNHQWDEVTTQHNRGACTVDFIFYNVLHKEVKTRRDKIHTRNIREGKLRLLKRYGLMSEKEISKLGGLPNALCPSDHVPLISTFILSD